MIWDRLDVYLQQKKGITLKDEDMITILFLIIALAMSPFFIKKKDTVGNKVIYFVLSVVLTPLIGPFIYRFIKDSKTDYDDGHKQSLGGDAWC